MLEEGEIIVAGTDLTKLSSFLFVAVAYLLAMLLSGRKLKKVDMVESLKCATE